MAIYSAFFKFYNFVNYSLIYEPSVNTNLIFLRRSKSSLSFMSRALDTTCEYRPSLWSFFLFKNQSGILNWRGFPTMTIRFSSSAAESSPALCTYRNKRISTTGHNNPRQPPIPIQSFLALPNWFTVAVWYRAQMVPHSCNVSNVWVLVT